MTAADGVVPSGADKSPGAHGHHPANPNAGVVRGRLSPAAILAAVVTAAVTVAGIVVFALAIGGAH